MIDWRRYDHPDRRGDNDRSYDIAIANSGSGGVGKASVARTVIYKDFHLYGRLVGEELPPVTFPSPKPPRLGREFDFD